ncbi:signal peptide-containing protein [Diplodia corticola]|uniref:Signal peptide-containing protein n=1 Tax=Diplodia corticola TaxID=236234 RepID=A0A1J9SA16_9PEZI|nr:signal peptide-containing protein [Diplodia corticola]OJD36421.1 signal peptide-containing protein [Diplodia corticola]
MSIARGIQSAIFFYLSCAPCVGMATQRRMKREARRDRIEKAALQLESPDAYRHPDPSSTNPHWDEEIALGPGPPPRGKRKNKRNIGTAGTQGSARSRVNSDFDGDGVAGIEMSVSPGASNTSLDGRWDTRRDEREDDDTWGVETISSRGGIRLSSSAGSATGLVPLSRPSTGRSASDSYYTPRPPPVNEYHPPVVSAISSNAGANSWMLAPPPSAKVMSGKKKTSPSSRSGSRASSRGNTSLRREVSQRGIAEKIKRGETPEVPPGSRGSAYVRDSKSTHGSPKTALSPSSSAKKSSHERRSVAEDSDASDDSLPRDKRHDSGNHLALISPNVERGSPKHNKAVRQRLSTVHSGETLVKRPNTVRASTHMDLKTSVLHKENISELPVRSKTTRVIKKPEPLVIRDSSLNLLQELVSPNALLNSQFVKSPTLEARIQLPPTNSTEELQLRSLSPWFPSDDFIVAADDSGSDYSKNARLRWSMDI